MRCCFEKKVGKAGEMTDRKQKPNAILCTTLYAKRAFSLIEVLTSLAILALVSSSVLVVIDRCMSSAADSVLHMQAFWVARENMETILSSSSVSEMTEYGSSDKYPEIQWQNVVETFYEPMGTRTWLQAICSAEYTDTAGDIQKIELIHWLTDLSKKQVLQLTKEEERDDKPDTNEPGE